MREKDIRLTRLPGRKRSSVKVDNIPDIHDPRVKYSLTLRELEVLQQRRQGLRIPKVAAELGISADTVKVIISRAVNRNSTDDAGPKVYALSLLLAAESSGLLSDEMLYTLLKVAQGTISEEEGQDTLSDLLDPVTIYPEPDDLL